MSRFPEIAFLFASLASNLQSPDPTAKNEIDCTISNLNRSLNLTETPRTCILDAALSLMCITAPQVYDMTIEFTMRTIVTVLTSLIECKVLRINKDQVLRVGGSIPQSHVANIMEWCEDILRKLGGHKGDLCDTILYSVIKLAALAPSLHCAVTSRSNLEMKFNDGRESFLANVLCHVPSEINIQSGKIPLRLLIWHLDPMILKQDVSEILREVTDRPFLSLSIEFYERIDWRSKLICLVMSPSLFFETRALLHNWFLRTGLASVMELLTELVVQVLDIISRPMRWVLSMEVGSKLPFSHAYFPHNHQWLRILSGPISHDYFQHLLHVLSKSISHAGGHVQTSSKKAAKGISTVDHKSMWAIAMNFPGWFSFASVLLFYENGSSKPFLLNNVKVPCSVAAARYIAWIMNPINESHEEVLVEHLLRVSELWTLKRFSLNDLSMGLTKENRRHKLRDKSDTTTSHDLDIKTIWLWLKEFKDMYKYFESKDGLSGSRTEGFRLLLNRIPLGILIGYLSQLNKDGCALILHCAAIGNISNFSENKVSEQKQRWKYGLKGGSVEWSKEYNIAEAVAGCRIVFDITDVTETLSSAMFETEEEEVKFMCQLKLKTGDYLLQCMKRLLQLKFDKDGLQMKNDLLSRVIRWKHQRKDAHQGNKDLDRVCDSLKL